MNKFMQLSAVIFFLSAFDCTGYNTFNNVFLAYQIYNNDRNDIDHDTCHHRSHLHMSEASAEILDCHRNGTIFLDIQYQCRQKVVIPYPHQFQDRGRDNCWFQDRDQNLSLTGGDPGKQSQLLALNIYDTFYARSGAQWKGIGQAKAVVFFLLVVAIALIQLRATSSKEVQQ